MVCVDSTWISTAEISVCSSIGNPNQEMKNRECAPKGSQRWDWMEQQTADSSQQVQKGTAKTHHAKTGGTVRTTKPMSLAFHIITRNTGQTTCGYGAWCL